MSCETGRTRGEAIGAKGRVSKLVKQYFEGLVGQDIASGYIKVTVDNGVASFALFGTNDLSVLSANPAAGSPIGNGFRAKSRISEGAVRRSNPLTRDMGSGTSALVSAVYLNPGPCRASNPG